MNGRQHIRIDMTGQQYGLLSGLSFSHVDKKGSAHWNFMCACGVTKSANGSDVRSGRIISCGHVKAMTGARNQLRHGHARRGAKTVTYRCWRNMITRCYDPKSERYKNYGGRGIAVCAAWKTSYEAFLSDMGECPDGLTLERNDVHGDYGPDNCRWATWEEQRANTTRSAKNRRPA